MGLESGNGGVVHANQGRWRDRPVRVGVRAVHAGARHLVGAVADAVAIGVRIEWARARVRAVDVVAGAGLGAVGQAIAVVVAVCHEAGRRALGRVVVARQVVGQAVSVVIGQAPQVEREGLGGAAVVRGGHGVGGGRHRSVDRAGDPARGRVDGEVDRKRGRDGPRGRAVGEWWVEADRIDRQVLDHGVGVVRVHAEVQLVRGRITALVGMDRVGLVEGVDRRRAAYDAVRDGHARWEGGVRLP